MRVYLLAYYTLLFNDQDYDFEANLEALGMVRGISDGVYLLVTRKDANQIQEVLEQISGCNRFAVAELNSKMSHLTDSHATFIKNIITKEIP
jgi:hypothetical protein